MLNTLNGETLTVSINGAVVKFVSSSGSSTTVITADVDSSNACVLERAQARSHARTTQRAHLSRPFYFSRFRARACRAIHIVDTVVLPSGISPVPSKSGSASIAVSLASALVAVVAVALSL